MGALNFEDQYRAALRECLDNGDPRVDRTGVGTKALFGVRIEHDWKQGAPVVTGRKIAVKTAISEMMWFLSGETDKSTAPPQVASWWSSWSAKDGSMGQGSYAGLIRNQRWVEDNGHVHTCDQLKQLIKGLDVNPWSRRHVLSAWNAAVPADHQALAPCHANFSTFHCKRNGELDMVAVQRSADSICGLPHNIAQHGALQLLVAHVVGRRPGKLVYNVGDFHVYDNHREYAERYLALPTFELPRYEILGNHSSFDTMGLNPIVVQDYHHGPSFGRIPVAV